MERVNEEKADMEEMREKKPKGSDRNRGSAIVEITLLVPVLFGCVYFFIMTMLYMVRQAQAMDDASDCVYESQDNMSTNPQEIISSDGNTTAYRQGNTKVIEYKEEWEGYDIYVELRVDDSDPVKNLRRWQLVSDAVR